MSSFDLSKLRYVTIDDYEELRDRIGPHQTPRSAYDIVNIMIWGTQFKAQWMEYKGRLIIYNERWTCILMPLGIYLPPEEMIEISNIFCAEKKCGTISLVDNEYIALYGDSFKNFDIVKDYDTADYIYIIEKLARLSGKKLQKKKNLISQFRKQYGDYEVSSLNAADAEECLSFSDQWFDEHPEDKELGYKYERMALSLSFEYFDRLNLEGIVIRHNGRMIAFSIFSEQKEDMAIVHFEKFARDVKGSAQLINWETAKHLNGRYHYINREEDMGIPGLRKSKQSYQPLMVLDSYKIIRHKR